MAPKHDHTQASNQDHDVGSTTGDHSGVAATHLQPGMHKVTATKLNLRSAPVLDGSNIVSTAANGTFIEVLPGEPRHGFYPIRIDKNTLGWASGHYLDAHAGSGNAAIQRIIGTPNGATSSGYASWNHDQLTAVQVHLTALGLYHGVANGARNPALEAALHTLYGDNSWTSLSATAVLAKTTVIRAAAPPPQKIYTLTLLIGSAYVQDGKSKPYGHCALRIVDGDTDTTYDYGRYGKTWGTGSSEGEGILRVWSNFAGYIGEENATGRTTTAYTFNTTQQGAKTIEQFFAAKIAGHPVLADRGVMKQYRIGDDYDALSSNCTTLSLAAAKLVMPHLDDRHKEFDDGRGLSGFEKAATVVAGWPDDTFMPADLKAELDASTGPQKPLVQSFSKR